MLREAAGFSRDDIAFLLDVSIQHIASIEYGSKGMSVKVLLRLSAIFGVTTDYILNGRTDEASKASMQGLSVKSFDELVQELIALTAAYLNK